MLQCLCQLQQTIVHHLFGHLMDDKNLIIEAQAAGVLFILQILNSTQELLHQHCLCMLSPHFFQEAFC